MNKPKWLAHYLYYLLFGGQSWNRSGIRYFCLPNPFRLLQGSRSLVNNDFRLRKGRSVKLRSQFNLVPSLGILGTVRFHGLSLLLLEGGLFFMFSAEELYIRS
jgi:hypothetical protein